MRRRRPATQLALAAAGLLTLSSAVIAAPVPAPDFTVSGRFLYEDKAWDYGGWTGERPELPVRGADVTVRDAASGKLLGRGATTADGTFTVSCQSQAAVVDLEVRVESRNRHQPGAAAAGDQPGAELLAPFTSIAVLDPSGAPYAAFAPTWPAHDSSQDADVGTTTVLALWLPEGDGNPFNVFDQAVSAWQYVTGPEIGAAHKQRGIKLHWPSLTGSWALGRHAWIASDDGYDDAVILHEIGHVVHNLYSDSDSPGGVHFFGDSDQEPRLAFAEGYATSFGGSVLDFLGREGLYVDCTGTDGVGGIQLRLKLETTAPYTASTEGACDEVAVACTLFDFADDAASPDDAVGDDDGFVAGTLVAGVGPARAWWQVLTGPVRKAAGLTIDHVWDGWHALYAGDGQEQALQELFDQLGMRFWNDEAEPDNTLAQAKPIAPLAGNHWSPEYTLYYSPDPATTKGTGDRDWFSVELQAGQLLNIETRYPDGAWDARTQADTFLALHDPQGKHAASDEASGAGRNACIDAFEVPVSGTWRFMVRSRNDLHRYGRYEVRVVFPPQP